MIRDIGYMKILKTGPGTSIQDSGRTGYATYGVPISGALDNRSFRWVNHLLKNQETDAALEISQPGLQILFDAPTLICFGGAMADIKLNGRLVSSFGIIEISENDILEIGSFHQGSLLYLGIKNGFQSEKIMNSRSWFEGITASRFSEKGTKIPYFTNQEIPVTTASKVKWDFRWAQHKIMEAYPGPDWELLPRESQELIKSMEFTISGLKNRMATQLLELLPNDLQERLTAPVFPGTIQLTSGGKLIILMKDSQVTGGYPRILQLTEQAMEQISQKRPSDKIVFQLKKL